MMNFISNPSLMISFGLLLLRIALGAFMLTHGLPKWRNFTQLSAQFPSVFGFTPRRSLELSIFAEVFCSVLIILGLFTQFAAIPLLITMIVAAFFIHRQDPFVKKELAMMYGTISLFLFFSGGGVLSLDYLLFNH
ncbi:MAG: DoxX family protein [Chitinophagaceae bacterium]